eukprot:4216432-Alexandrium_andersonii.AAC.1
MAFFYSQKSTPCNPQSAIRARPVSAAIRFNAQSAMRKTQTRFRRSNLELRGPGSGLKTGPQSS